MEDLFRSRNDGSVTLYCFTPLVTLITFLVEIIFALYVWMRYSTHRFGRVAAVFLVLLSGFQISEYIICKGGSVEMWSRAGFICTVFLPILGIDFVLTVSGSKARLTLGYAIAFAYATLFAIMPGLFPVAQCTGKFVIFTTGLSALDISYALYYFAALFYGIGLMLDLSRNRKGPREALRWLLLGYAAFMIPAFSLFIFVSVSRDGFPSILCGFAILMAFILVFKVLPAVDRRTRA